jgi:regulator of sigma E protease
VEATATTRDLFPVLNMIAFINVALGLTNLLPIPALDGGRIMFVLVEAVRGRRIEPEREGMVHVIGMLVLLGLMVLLMVQDIVNPIIPF